MRQIRVDEDDDDRYPGDDLHFELNFALLYLIIGRGIHGEFWRNAYTIRSITDSTVYCIRSAREL